MILVLREPEKIILAQPLAELNAETLVTTVTKLVPPAVLHLIAERLLVIMNAVRLAENAAKIALPV